MFNLLINLLKILSKDLYNILTDFLFVLYNYIFVLNLLLSFIKNPKTLKMILDLIKYFNINGND